MGRQLVFLFCLCAIWFSLGQAQDPSVPPVEVRVRGGLDEREGRAEIRYNGTWGTICDDDWSVEDAAVFCKMLGYVGRARAMAKSAYGNGTGPIWLDSVGCDGSEPSIVDCPHEGWGVTNCNHGEDAGVICFGERVTTTRATTPFIRTTTTTLPPRICNNASQAIRLLDGRNEAEGRVEVFREGRWGSICDDDWGQADAAVICRMLCYNPANARAHLGEEFGNATSAYWLDNVRCQGNEGSIADCQHPGWGVMSGDCDVTEAAGVSCIRDQPGLPPVPTPEIDCSQEQIVAKFSRLAEPRLQRDHLTLPDGDVSCGYTTSTDVNYVYISIPFVGCGTTREKNSTHILYRNAVRHSVPPADPVITRQTTYTIDVFCALPRDADRDNNIEPIAQTAPPQVGDGKFDVRMTLYKNSRFDEPISTFPAQLKLGEWLYVGVTLSSADTGLKLIVPNCTATPTSDRQSRPSYPFITDKCKVESSVTFYPFNETIFAFRFQTFKFFGDYQYVYLHCDAFICEISEKNVQCDRSCSTRTKRSVSLSHPHPLYYVDRGPLVLTGDVDDGGGGRPKEISSGNGALSQVSLQIILWFLVTLISTLLLHL